MEEPTYKPSIYYELRQRATRMDPLRLGEEIIELPDLIMTVGEHLATVQAARDIAVNDLKVAQATAASMLRRDVKPGEKPKSESQVTADVPKHPLVKKAMEEVERTKLDAALWTALMEAAQSKQSALKRLTELIVAGYLSSASFATARRVEVRKHRGAD